MTLAKNQTRIKPHDSWFKIKNSSKVDKKDRGFNVIAKYCSGTLCKTNPDKFARNRIPHFGHECSRCYIYDLRGEVPFNTKFYEFEPRALYEL